MEIPPVCNAKVTATPFSEQGATSGETLSLRSSGKDNIEVDLGDSEKVTTQDVLQQHFKYGERLSTGRSVSLSESEQTRLVQCGEEPHFRSWEAPQSMLLIGPGESCPVASSYEKSVYPSAASSSYEKSVAELCLPIFGIDVTLPPTSSIVNHIGKIVEVAIDNGCFSLDFAKALQALHPQILIELVDDLLVFHMPSSHTTDCLNVFEPQVQAYILRYGKEFQISTCSSSSLFHVPNYMGHICPDYSIIDIVGYDQKVSDTRAHGKTIPEDVRVYLTMEMQSLSQKPEEIQETCMQQSKIMDCVSMALLVTTGVVEIYCGGNLRHSEFNPRYIDIGVYSSSLKGLRLYMQCLRNADCWSYQGHHNRWIRGHPSELMDAISNNDFDLAEEVINYMSDTTLREDVRPLLLAVEKAATYQPGAFEFVRYMLDNGVTVNADVDGVSPMLIAQAENHHPLLSFLHSHGAACIMISNEMLAYAVDERKNKMASLLIKAGCVPTSAMLVSAIRRDNIEMVKLLIKGGCDPNDLDASSGKLPLSEAMHSAEMVFAILDSAREMGMNYLQVHKKDLYGISPWDVAERSGKRDVMDRLKIHGEKKRIWPGLRDIIEKTLKKLKKVQSRSQ